MLTDNCFLSFKSSKGTDPIDVIVLRYSRISIDESFIKDGQWVMTISTPLSKFWIRAKHLTSLSEWILAADKLLHKKPTFANGTEVLKVTVIPK
jgi:hypothetical protein